jgi:hypothetical protein
MKKSTLVLAVVFLTAAMTSGHAFAQSLSNQVPSNNKQLGSAPVQMVDFTYNSFDPSSASPARMNEINVKAIRDFKGRFSTAKNENWYTVKGGFVSYFTLDGFGDRAFYDKKGHWQGTLRFCAENKLPVNIRATVKSTYYDFAITIIEIVEVPDHLAYLVHLEDKTSIKIVRVSEEGEMDVLEDYIKG